MADTEMVQSDTGSDTEKLLKAQQYTGHIIINRNVYNSWTPARIKCFHAFLNCGRLKSENDIKPHHVDFYLCHPDFIAAHNDGEYILKWDKFYDGYNHNDFISALFTKQPDGKPALVKRYAA